MRNLYTLSAIVAIAMIVVLPSSFAQTNIFPSMGSAGIGTTAPNASSLLEMKSTSQGILIPRMSKVKRDAIINPATGLLIYQTNVTAGFYYYDGSTWQPVNNASVSANTSLSNLAHPTSINSNLTPDITNNRNLGNTTLRWRNVYLDSNVYIGGARFLSSSGTENTFVGSSIGLSNVTGKDNTATGFYAFKNNVVGKENTASGAYALYSNSSGDDNVANGYKALYSNQDGSENIANGNSALKSNTAGNANIANGAYALSSNIDGNDNVANGLQALSSNTHGSENTANGTDALYGNTTGNDNTANGFAALFANKGSNNTATGAHAMNAAYGSNNTADGVSALSSADGNSNTATGYYCLYDNFGGSFNTASGALAMYYTSGGSDNTGMGYEALYSNENNYNTAVGYKALFTNKTGYNNTALGIGADASVNNLINSTAIGANAIVNVSNKIRLGDGYITVVESNAGSWTISDKRFKNNIKENVKGLQFINLLKPVTYNFDTKKFEEFLMQNYPDSIKSERLAAINKEAIAKSSAVLQSGFVAQDVAEAAKKSGYNFNGVHAPENPTDNWSLSYEKLVVPLVKAVQELSKLNDNKDSAIQQQDIKISELESRLLKLEVALNTQSTGKSNQVSIAAAVLEQNIPNPFNHTTTINYILPLQYSSAKILVTDKTGKALKEIALSSAGKGNLKVDASTLAAGAYSYSLYIDGRLVDTKQMVLTK